MADDDRQKHFILSFMSTTRDQQDHPRLGIDNMARILYDIYTIYRLSWKALWPLIIFSHSFPQVSNLFQRDEIDEITQDLIPVMKKEYPKLPPTNENLYDYFITRVKNNLHVVLCFSPVSYLAVENLFKRCMDAFEMSL